MLFLFLSFRRVLNVMCSLWVIPRRLSSNSRCFGTHCQFRLHRQVNEVCQWMECVGYLYLIELEQGSGRANRKWCARTGRVDVQQVVEGGL